MKDFKETVAKVFDRCMERGGIILGAWCSRYEAAFSFNAGMAQISA